MKGLDLPTKHDINELVTEIEVGDIRRWAHLAAEVDFDIFITKPNTCWLEDIEYTYPTLH